MGTAQGDELLEQLEGHDAVAARMPMMRLFLPHLRPAD